MELFVPQIGEVIVDVMTLVPEERVQQRIDEQISWTSSCLRSRRKPWQGCILTPHEREQERHWYKVWMFEQGRIAMCWNDPVRPNKEEIEKVRQFVPNMSEFVEGRRAVVWFCVTLTLCASRSCQLTFGRTRGVFANEKRHDRNRLHRGLAGETTPRETRESQLHGRDGHDEGNTRSSGGTRGLERVRPVANHGTGMLD